MSYRRPDTLSFMPCVRWPPCGRARPMIVSPGPQQRVVDGRVGLGARVRLDVGVLGPEQLLGAVDRQLLGDVDVLAAAVVAAPGIALGVLVGQHAALALEDGLGHEVLGGDHLERALLARQLEAQDVGDHGIDNVQRKVEGVGAQLGHACDGTSLRRPSSRRDHRRCSRARREPARCRSSPPARPARRPGASAAGGPGAAARATPSPPPPRARARPARARCAPAAAGPGWPAAG